MMKTLSIPGYKPEPQYIIQREDGQYLAPDNVWTPDKYAAIAFLVRDGEWGADARARRAGGKVVVR
jgi:hypothetical protein